MFAFSGQENAPDRGFGWVVSPPWHRCDSLSVHHSLPVFNTSSFQHANREGEVEEQDIASK